LGARQPNHARHFSGFTPDHQLRGKPPKKHASTGENMCNCRDRIEKMLTKQHAQIIHSDTDHKAKLMGYGIEFTSDGGVVETSFMPVELYSTRLVKKTGTHRRVTTKLNMHFSYCPFCGEKREANRPTPSK
jgi:hypothetical protein